MRQLQFNVQEYEVAVNSPLMATGWFSTLGQWEWVYPLQMQGTLATHESFIFSYRGRTARLTIALPGDGENIRDYRRIISAYEDQPLPPEHCLSLIREWVGDYRANV